MARHHPYGGDDSSFEMRRGGPPGPDRPQRFSAQNNGGRGGFSRRRGGYGGDASVDGSLSHGAHDPLAEPSMAPHNNYKEPPQDPYYQNNSYGAGPQSQYLVNPPPSAGYEQGYSNAKRNGSNFNNDFGAHRPVRKDKDGKLDDSSIEERIQRERPCRTLFMRNIEAIFIMGSNFSDQCKTDGQDVRNIFEVHGEVKSFFDLISTRGMVLVTYYDLRAAERARNRLQGSQINGRPIDVHYSLPRNDHSKEVRSLDTSLEFKTELYKQQLQGCLQVTLRSSTHGQIDNNQVRHKFQQFGDVRSVKPVGDRSDSRYVELYDTRACDEAYDRLRHQGLQDGVMDIVFAWDGNEGYGPQGQKWVD
ncbi:hypothetical protein K438DRAFT_1587884 [Mycena galopus ATCC 62051]|nr:hypothetical protein K438DRAFT_1587884 [Mycena galopus ATCC 62051]